MFLMCFFRMLYLLFIAQKTNHMQILLCINSYTNIEPNKTKKEKIFFGYKKFIRGNTASFHRIKFKKHKINL